MPSIPCRSSPARCPEAGRRSRVPSSRFFTGEYMSRAVSTCARAQAAGVAGALALQHRRIEPAARRILDAGRPSRRRARRRPRRPRDAAAGAAAADRRAAAFVSSALCDADGLGGASGPVKAGRAGDDAVEVRRETLGFRHRLTAAGGTPVPVRELRRGAVVSGHDRLRRRRSSREPPASRNRSAFSGCPSAKLAVLPT